MKISKSLLQAIALGVTLSAATSCTKDYHITDLEAHQSGEATEQTDEANNGESTNGDDRHNACYDCPACGLG